MRDIPADIERRRDQGDDPCDSCHATGLYDGKVCIDCLGQKILLTRREYDTLFSWAARADDAVLDQAAFYY